VTLGAALRMYRRGLDQAAGARAVAASASAPTTRPALEPGVFPYTTTGSESLSLMGMARAFPSRTDMVVERANGACSTVDWVPLVQHSELMTVCPHGSRALSVTDFVTHETIGGTTTTSVVDCPATLYLVPPVATVGERWSARCHEQGPSQNVAVDGLVVGASSLDVGGVAVPTVHVRLSMFYNGATTGTAPTDLWISMARGLVVQEREVDDVNQDGVHYHEQMGSLLISLQPAR